MGGIAGTFAFPSGRFRITGAHLARMRDAMACPGPDAGNDWIAPDGKIGLAHRRPSFLESQPPAAQPMGNEDGSVWVSCEGSLDAAAILRAYAQWGIDCLRRFRGAFAFALWDGRSRELWLVRDRLGIKPLYYSVHHGRLNFASEIRPLLKDPEQPRVLDETSFFHFLSFMTVPSPETLFEGIRKLPPGTWVRVREDGEIREQRYWELWDNVRPLRDKPVEEIRNLLLEKLREAVSMQTPGDRPAGVFLSGGVDSSAIAALLSGGGERTVRTFTIGFQDGAGAGGETENARALADKLSADYRERLLSPDDFLGFLPALMRLQDEPIGDPMCALFHYAGMLAREDGIGVCQLGEGSDELFQGYPSWKRMLALQRLDDWPAPRALKAMGAAALRMLGKGEAKYTEWLRRGAEGVPIFWGGEDGFTREEKARLLGPRLKARFAGRTSWEALRPIRERFLSRAPDPSPLNWMSYLDLNLRLPELLLARVDKVCRNIGVEARMPFLDHEFVEFAMGIPSACKTAGEGLKPLLKGSLRGLLPQGILLPDPEGSGLAMETRVLQRLGKTMRDELKAFCERTGLIDFRAVEGYAARGRGYPLWYLYGFALWHRQSIEEA
jgi:asparagine synthase (glutamine-hydrolysing)